MTTPVRRLRFLGAAAILLASAAACGGDDDAASGEEGGAASAASTAASDGTSAEGQSLAEGSAPEVDTSESMNVTMGSTNAQSSAYALFTTQGRMAGEVDGNLQVNVRETAASTENIQLVNDGDVEVAISSWELLYQAQQGLGEYEGDAKPDLVPIFTYLQLAEFMVARADDMDSDAPTVADLAGKSVAPSSQGASTYEKWAAIFDILGVEVNTFDGSLEDVINGLKDQRVTAFGKSANGTKPDASMLDVASSTDLVPVTLTEEDVAAIEEEVPYYDFFTVPEGAMDGWPEFTTPQITAVFFVRSDMPDDEVFRITRALWESLDPAAQASSFTAAQDIPASLTMETTDLMPLHPGAQAYFDSIGEG